jgi:D-3-phosphoglycerate dehydrogenase
LDRIGISTSSFGNPDRSPIAFLEQHDVEVVNNPFGRRLTRPEALEFIHDLDGLIAGLEPLDREVLQSTRRLRAIARVGIGMDNVDEEYAAERGIAVSNTPEPPTFAVAEMTVTAMLSLVREVCTFNRAMHDGKWEKQVTSSLMGLTVHLIGLGRIGRKVARLLSPFEVDLLVTDPFLSETDLGDTGVLVPLDDGLQRADVISLHASGAETILGSRELSMVRQGVIILNSARGSLVDEKALLQALQSGVIGGVWFDTFQEEPYEGPLRDFPNVLLTPHISTYTVSCRRSMEMEAARNIIRDLGQDM